MRRAGAALSHNPAVARREVLVDPKANREQVLEHKMAIRQFAADLGLTNPRIRDDGTVVVHSDEPGYGSVFRLSDLATDEFGVYVLVITDDVPGAVGAQDL